MTIKKWADWINSVWGAMTAFGVVVALGISIHNWWFMDKMAPVLRRATADQIANYRQMDCDGRLGPQQRISLDLALEQYRELVGRDIAPAKPCE